jgi:hypothetical protein
MPCRDVADDHPEAILGERQEVVIAATRRGQFQPASSQPSGAARRRGQALLNVGGDGRLALGALRAPAGGGARSRARSGWWRTARGCAWRRRTADAASSPDRRPPAGRVASSTAISTPRM